MTYDVTIIAVRPGTHPDALARLRPQLLGEVAAGEFLACWYSDLGAINQILLLHGGCDEAAAVARRAAIVTSKDPFGVGEFMTGVTMDTYVSFPFMPRITPGRCGPIYEVRSYVLRPDGLATTIELWRKAVPGRLTDQSADIEASGLFSVVCVRQYDWERVYDADGYIELLDTFSGHIAMAPWQRERLYGEIRRRLSGRPSGTLRRHWGAVLHVARRS